MQREKLWTKDFTMVSIMNFLLAGTVIIFFMEKIITKRLLEKYDYYFSNSLFTNG